MQSTAMALELFVQMCDEMPPKTLELISTNVLKEEVQEILEYSDDERPVVKEGFSPKTGLSLLWVEHCLKKRKVLYTRTNNIFQGWARKKTTKGIHRKKQKGENKNYEYEQIFTRHSEEQEFPPESDLKKFEDHKAHIVKGYNDGGSNASVFTLVEYNQLLCAIKRTTGHEEGEEGYYSDDNENILFEIMTHSYLYEKIKENENDAYLYIKIPEILFVQQAPVQELKVDICMRRAEGWPLVAFIEFGKEAEQNSALAHVLKALWHLQKDYDFMHRDLSGTNVFYDDETRKVTFIDFGHSCVKINGNDKAWQYDEQSFFIRDKNDDNYASNCQNRSLDACILITYLSVGANDNTFLRNETNDMKKTMKKLYEKNKTVENNIGEGRFTNTDVVDWYPGNGPKGDGIDGGEAHHWIYEFVEFPMENWYPEKILKRLLLHVIPDEWSHIRNHWEEIFDTIINEISLQDFKEYCKKNGIEIHGDARKKNTYIQTLLGIGSNSKRSK